MKNIAFNKLIPYIIAILSFLLITIIYFYPVLEGKQLKQSDISNWRGMSKEIIDYRNETGEEALWTNSMFGGMPAYQISVNYKGNISRYAAWIIKLRLPRLLSFVYLYFIGFFILLRVFKVKLWLSIAGAFAFGFSSYFFIIFEPGHLSKAHAIGYMALVLAGVLLTFRKKYLAGGALTALFLSLELKANHPQITYYLLIIIFILGVFEFIDALRTKRHKQFIKSVAVLLVAVVLALLVNIPRLWGTYEYSKYTIRNKSELSFDKTNQTSGLDKDYITAWSYGIPETMTLLIPNFQGGASYGELSKKSETYEVLTNNNVPNANQIVKQVPLYWGNQPFTSGPVYIGAIVVFLFVFGLFVVKGPIKWWLVTATILSIVLAWGKNFMPLTNFFLDYVPMYNKFRAVSMTLVIAELTMPLLGFIALQKIFEKDIDKRKIKRALKRSFYIVGGITLIFVLLPGIFFNFVSPKDAQTGFPDWLMSAIQADRLKMLRMDALRSFVFIALFAGLLWAYLSGKVKTGFVYVGIVALIIIDMWPVDKRYLNNDNFIRKSVVEKPFIAANADKAILEDKDPNFRVFNLAEDFDKSARTSYFHKNIGGYHGAKFRRYQELIDYHLSGEREQFVTILSNRPDNLALNVGLMQLKVFNMLNTKYIIYDLSSRPLINNFALGNAWFVKDYKIVANADEEITALNDFIPEMTAVIDKRFNEYLKGYKKGIDTAGHIELASYKPNHLIYHYQSAKEQLVVFSEIFYDKGWNAYIDDKLYPHFRANYLLRAMILPEGEHTIDFIFEPKSHYTGEKISLAASLLMIFALLGAGFLEIRKKGKPQR